MQDFIRWFRGSTPYINTHRGRTFVVFLDGRAFASEQLPGIVQDLALLSSLGVRLAVVLGARPQIDKALTERNLECTFSRGQRITTAAALEAIIMTIGAMKIQMESLLSTGLPNTPMYNTNIQMASGNYVFGKPMGVVDGVDHLFTGAVRRIHQTLLRRHLYDGAIALLTPLGYSISGEVFNVPSEQVAAAAAAAVEADKLIMLTDDPILTRGGQMISSLTSDELRAHAAERKLPPDSIAALRISVLLQAGQAGTPRCHLVDPRTDGALLLELFSHQGIGTQIAERSGEVIRQARLADIGGILELIEPLEQSGVLVRRGRDRLEQEITHFQVADMDGLITGCAALYPVTTGHLAELACIVSHPEYRGRGRGDALLQAVEKKASALGFKQLMVLTTMTEHWFAERGFLLTPITGLPDAKRNLYNYQRKSKVLIKTIGAIGPRKEEYGAAHKQQQR